jgi:flagellar hook protein FlgE
MANSLITGVTGLRVNQQMLDVVGNNLANSNTTGFKSQRVRFGDLVYQTLNQAATSSSPNVGGINPLQIGLGAKVAAIDSNLAQGSLESTNNDLDMAIQGNGYFVANNGLVDQYTRAGAFGIDSKNYVVDPSNGFHIQRFGTIGEGTAATPAFQTAGNSSIKIPIGTAIPGKATTTIDFQGNLAATAQGPAAQVLTSSQPFVTGGVAATATTALNSIDDNTAPYVAGDQLLIQGTTVNNAMVNTTLNLTPTSTLGDLVNAINAAFPGATASLDANGNLVVTANNTGPSPLGLSISDATANTGASNWTNHGFSVTTPGKDGDTVTTGIQVFDVQGTSHSVNLVFQKQSNNVWNLTASIPASEGTLTDNLVTGITFNDDGSFRQVTGIGAGNPTLTMQINGLANPQTIGFNFGSLNGFNGLTQVGGSSSAIAKDQDGYEAGFLTNISVDQDGIINGVFTNGRTLPIAQLAIATFANPSALLRQGNNYFGLSSESGNPLLGAALSDGRGSIQEKALETSNVDIALEFTRLIIAQRGFQMNARTITASDQVLQELANIIR